MKCWGILNSATLFLPLPIFVALCSAPIGASAVTTYASVSGNNGNSCLTPASPCLTISAAMTKAKTTGFARVIALAPRTLTESVALSDYVPGQEIIGSGGFVGIQPPTGGTGVTIDVGGSGSVRIGYLQLLGNHEAGLDGVKIETASSVDIENVEFHGFSNAAIELATSTSPYSALTLSNSVVAGNECVILRPTGGAGSNVLIENTAFRNCPTSLLVDASSTTKSGSAAAIIRRSSFGKPRAHW